jgi:hypothetical protein
MNLNNEIKRSSLSARASKIPQKLVQSSTILFSARTSVSSNMLSSNTRKIGNKIFGGSSSLSAIQKPSFEQKPALVEQVRNSLLLFTYLFLIAREIFSLFNSFNFSTVYSS